MENSASPTLYIRLRRRAVFPRGKTIRLKDIAHILAEPKLQARLLAMPVHQVSEKDGNFLLIDMIQITRKIRNEIGPVTIEHFGEPHILVEIGEKGPKSRWFWIGVAWILLFIGSGLAIMNFHEDVSMKEVHRRLAELITGRWDPYPLLLQIPYSIGIGLGMIVFFNHLFKKKFNQEEPSPLEVEMFMYQESVNQYVITEEYQKLHEREREK